MDDLGFHHKFIAAPAGTGRSTVLLLHGTGGDENSLIAVGRTLAPAAHLLAVRGNVLEAGMPRFFARFAEGRFDEDDIRARASELAGFVPAAAERYNFDAATVTALGYSNGANIAAALLLLQPQLLQGAVLLRGMVPLVPEILPDISGRQVWLGSGRTDALVPAENAVRLAGLLRAAGATVVHAWHPGGHHLAAAELEEVAQWMAQHVK